MKTYGGLVKLFNRDIELHLRKTFYFSTTTTGCFHNIESISFFKRKTIIYSTRYHHCREIAAYMCGDNEYADPHNPLVVIYEPSPESKHRFADSIRALNELERKHNYPITRTFKVRVMEKGTLKKGEETITENETRDAYVVVASPRWKSTSIHVSLYLLLLMIGCLYDVDYVKRISKSKKAVNCSSLETIDLRRLYLQVIRKKNLIGFLMDKAKEMRKLSRKVPYLKMFTYGTKGMINYMHFSKQPLPEEPVWNGITYQVPHATINYNIKLLLAHYVKENISDYSPK